MVSSTGISNTFIVDSYAFATRWIDDTNILNIFDVDIMLYNTIPLKELARSLLFSELSADINFG